MIPPASQPKSRRPVFWSQLQAWRAVRHLVGDLRPAHRYGRLVVYDMGKKWDGLKKKAAELRIRWDEQKQEYVAGAPDRRKPPE